MKSRNEQEDIWSKEETFEDAETSVPRSHMGHIKDQTESTNSSSAKAVETPEAENKVE